MSLYAIPPHHGAGLPPSNPSRLVAQIIFFAALPPQPPPGPPILAAAAAAPALGSLPGLNIARPQPGSAPSLQPLPSTSAQPPPQLLPAAPPQPPQTVNHRKRPRYMSSDDLLNALPAEVYTALDASSHLDITTRATTLHPTAGAAPDLAPSWGPYSTWHDSATIRDVVFPRDTWIQTGVRHRHWL
jgi:hypothetical protein